MLLSDHNEDEVLRIVVGYQNYTNVRALEQGVTAYNRRMADTGGPGRPLEIAVAVQSTQKVFDAAVTHNADLVLINPLISGYRHGLIQDLLLREEKPIPVMGMIPPRSDLGREMMNNGAKGTVTLPMDDSSVARFLQQAEQIVNAAWRERAEGRVHFGGQAFGGAEDLAYERKSIAVWVPKGGGSTRTTIATNLAVALSHLSLGGKPTVLVDLDMSKGDCHTLLGYTVNPDEAAQYQMPLLEYGLHTLVVRAAQKYGQKGVGVVDATLINRHLTHWRPNESQLRLLPGLTSPSQAAAEEFKNWPMLYDITRTLLGELRRMGTFVICDLGQDFTVPLHRAALEEVDEVLVTVPPTRTAITDTVYALPTLKHQMGGDLSKFKLVITAYDPAFGISDREMQRAIGLPLLTVIPHDALVAHQAVNEGLPFVLNEREGPLGSAIVELAGIYLPGMKQQRSGLRIGNLKRLFVREA